MNSQDSIKNILLKYPVCEYAFGDTNTIPFSDKVIVICRTDCRRYGHCWACPPHAGSIYDNMKIVQSYRHYLLFSTIAEVADNMNFDLSMEAKRPHEAVTRSLRRELAESFDGRFYVLSAGCMICDTCACPDEPCRHPEDRLMTTESHGIVLMQLVEESGLTFYYGGTYIAYFSLVLFD